MVANMGDDKIPLPRGVSARRYRDGWITWACDVYDTSSFRVPPPPELAIETSPRPAWPRAEWVADDSVVTAPLSVATRRWIESRVAMRHGATELVEAPSGLTHQEIHDLLNDPVAGADFALMSDLCHRPSRSTSIRSSASSAVRLRSVAGSPDVMPKIGNVVFEPLGPALFDGSTSVQADGSRITIVRGTSVRRFSDGWLVYAADYFDTAPMGDPEIQAASAAAGSTITLDDVIGHRST